MSRKSRTRSVRRLISLLILIALFALLWPLNAFLAGILAGGGRYPDPGRSEERTREPGTLRVTVLESDTGEPVEGAEIRVETHPGSGMTTSSGVGGEAVLRGVPAGPVRIEARHADGKRTVIWTDSGTDDQVSLEFSSTARRRGRVVHADGTPADALIRLLDSEGRELDRARTDSQGRFDVPDLAEVDLVIAEAERGAPSLSRSYDLVIEEGDLLQGRLLGVRPGKFEVYVVVPTDEDALLGFRTTWQLGPDGDYSGRLPSGSRAFGVVDGMPVRLDGTERELPTKVPQAVGRILKADGSVPSGVELTMTPDLDPTRTSPLAGRRVPVDGQGRFVARDLAEVPYRLLVRARGCATTIRDDVTLGAAPVLIELAPGFDLEGVVVGAGEIPIEGATVRAEGVPDPEHQWPIAKAGTDRAGRFELRGLGGAEAILHVTAPGFHPTTLEHVRPGAELRVDLQPR